ncbi:hypothetical protein SERLADRAFT_408931 [Serpula lacrymans var. lacrymans S7.9]|uniref:Uncharacterized protein n=1 Tax=Serpula lacrymans var. lacrymans (strain S7.9) TaxID=578457 RepID=F8NYD3_SERL9|nr:uncharacterized protein SERLADRAFT_408931 [Serpula lacrymans var. lacrymans S7.9]EGO23604.1 hypothetical protein SERLADRAFT_408931 [Serpula lacrymans var. lacrymans S7.9]
MSSNKSYHPSDSSSEMDESVGRISEVEDEIDDEDKDKDGDEENEHEHEDDGEENGEDEKKDGILFPSPSLSSSTQSDLPPELMNWPRLSGSPTHSVELSPCPSPGNFGRIYQPGPATAPSLSPSQLGQDILPSPTLSEVIHPHALSLSGRGHQCQYYTRSSSSSSPQSLNAVLTDWQMETRKQLGVVTKEKQQGTGKIKAWFVTHPALKAHFDQEEAEHSGKAKERAAKDAQKAVDEAVHTARIHKDTVLKNFEKPLLSYKHKDDLITVAGALQLSTTWDGHGTPH